MKSGVILDTEAEVYYYVSGYAVQLKVWHPGALTLGAIADSSSVIVKQSLDKSRGGRMALVDNVQTAAKVHGRQDFKH
jgi:hypothetical protein